MFQYSPENFENPVLQNHWRNIEALALDREEPDELHDYTSKLSFQYSLLQNIFLNVLLLLSLN